MSAIPISEATQRAASRLEEILTSPLFTTELDARASEGLPLPAPETWVQARLNLTRHWRALNVSEVLGVIHPPSAAEVVNDYTGSGEQYSRTQRVPYDVGIIVKASDAFPEVQTGGRSMLDDEWMQRRVELYRGAMLDIVPRYAPDPESIHEIYIESMAADLFEVPEMGRFAHATATFTVFQDVLINTW